MADSPVNTLDGSPHEPATRSAWSRRWLAVLLLGAVAGFLLSEVRTGVTSADVSPTGSGSARDAIVVAGQLAPSAYGLYVVDLASQTICVYEWSPQRDRSELRLKAARTLKYDRRLENYNTTPAPNEIKGIVELEQRGNPGDATAP